MVDIELAREAVAQIWRGMGQHSTADAVVWGRCDDWPLIRALTGVTGPPVTECCPPPPPAEEECSGEEPIIDGEACIVISYHHYETPMLGGRGQTCQQLRVTISIRRRGMESIVWSNSSSNGPFDFMHIMPAAREFAQELSEVLDAPITEIQQ